MKDNPQQLSQLEQQAERDQAERALLARIQKLEATLHKTYRRSRMQALKIKSLKNSSSWKLTKPVRVASVAAGKLKTRPLFKFLKNPVGYVSKQKFLRANFKGKSHNVTEMLPLGQLQHQVENPIDGPKISLLTALFNTPAVFLVEMLDSVVNQTYKNWELCLVDASAPDTKREAIVKKYRDAYPNIQYKKVENQGISGNLNHAMASATGDYFAVLDHDDILAPHALYETARAIAKTGAEFVYSDELLFQNDLGNISNYLLKTDFSPELLHASNYICHFAAFSRRVGEAVGALDPAADGAQDYDYFLRIYEQLGGAIAHIPIPLYYWRMHERSTAAGQGAKPYAAAAGERALRAHLARTNMAVDGIEDVRNHIGFHRVNYKISGEPKISVIITGGEAQAIASCAGSLRNTAWPNTELLVAFCGQQPSALLPAMLPKPATVVYGEKPVQAANAAMKQAAGDYVVLLSQDCRAENADWLAKLLQYAQQADIGVVGPKLLRADGAIYSGGQVLNLLGEPAADLFRGLHKNAAGYCCQLVVARTVSAVSGECLMFRRGLVQQLDESCGAYWYLDICLQMREQGLRNVFSADSLLYCLKRPTASNPATSAGIRKKWQQVLEQPDPFYNPNLSLESTTTRYKQELLPPFAE